MEDWQGLADRHGLIRTRDALQASLTSRHLARLVRDGELVRLSRGWYSLPLLVPSPDDHSAWEASYACCPGQGGRRLLRGAGRGQPPQRVGDSWRARLRRRPASGPPHADRRHLVAATSRPDLHHMVPGAAQTEGVIDLAVAIVQAGCVNGSMAAPGGRRCRAPPWPPRFRRICSVPAIWSSVVTHRSFAPSFGTPRGPPSPGRDSAAARPAGDGLLRRGPGVRR